jgi:hypothetical protein
MIDLQNSNGCSADGSAPHENRSVPPEVPFPFLTPGIVESKDFSSPRIDPCEIWSFKGITMIATKGEIIFPIHSSVLLGNDVLDAKYSSFSW